MEVILLERVHNLGNVGDVVRVKNGFARNFLLPRNKCLRATPENKDVFEARKAEIHKENEAKRKDAEKLADKIRDKFFIIIRQAGEDGRLYGSVSARDISDAISGKGSVTVDRSQVFLDKAIKNLGVYVVRIDAHADVPVTVRVNVARSEGEGQEAEKEFLNPSANKNAANNNAEAAPVEAAADESVEAAAEGKKAKKGAKKKKAKAEGSEEEE